MFLFYSINIEIILQPNTKTVAPTTSTKQKSPPEPSSDDANQSLNKSTASTGKKGFLRDRIAKRKEAETKEFGEEDETNKPVNELDELATEDISEFSLYRESYLLTVTEDQSVQAKSSSKDDSFDVTQMTNGQFESFAEVSAFRFFRSIKKLFRQFSYKNVFFFILARKS